MKTRTQFLKRAIIHTMLTGATYLAMPLAAIAYGRFMNGAYEGYTVVGVGILGIGSLILLIMSWLPVFDAEARASYNLTFNINK